MHLDQVLKFFQIKPDYDLNLMEQNQDLGFLISSILKNITNILKNEKFNWVLVQGDTASTMAGRMGAFLQKIPVGHLEAGLRTYDLYSPFGLFLFSEKNFIVSDASRSGKYSPSGPSTSFVFLYGE